MCTVNYISEPIGKIDFFSKAKENGIAVCPCCGFAYLSIEGSLSCKKCRNKRSNIRARANKKNAIVDSSITLLAVYNKFDGICNDCKNKLPHPNHNTANYDLFKPTIEHTIPSGKGGGHTWDNIELLCYGCNKNRNEIMQGKKC